MEPTAYTAKTLEAVRALHRQHGNVRAVIQAYLHRSEKDIEDLNRLVVSVRLLKGAYLESSDVAFAGKAEVDDSYRRLMRRLLNEGAYPALATHDETIVAEVVKWAGEQQIAPERFEFQMFYGIRRHLQQDLVRRGHRVRVYVPYGQAWFVFYAAPGGAAGQRLVCTEKFRLRLDRGNFSGTTRVPLIGGIVKYWGYFLAKLVAAAAIVYGLWRVLRAFGPRPAPMVVRDQVVKLDPFATDLGFTAAMMGLFLVSAALVALAVIDQKYRCRTCLRRLRMPVSHGQWDHVLLGRPRTEYICTFGHGTLKVPELRLASPELVKWQPNDDMWKELEELSELRK